MEDPTHLDGHRIRGPDIVLLVLLILILILYSL